MKPRYMLLIVCSFVLAGCQQRSYAPVQVSKQDESALIDAFLHCAFGSDISNGVPLVIQEKLSIKMLFGGEDAAKDQKKLIKDLKKHDKILAEATMDFFTKNAADSDLKSIGDIGVKHIVLTEQQYRDLFEKKSNKNNDGWKLFYELYPKSPGIITLSRPGFSSDGTIAVICMVNSTNWLAGDGRIYIVQKIDGKWNVSYKTIGPAVQA